MQFFKTTARATLSLSFAVALAAGCSSTPAANDAGSDASPVDAKADKVAPEFGDADAAGCPSGLACEVCDGAYSPLPMVTPYAAAGVCTTTDIDAFVAACGANGSQAACDAWQTSEGNTAAACYSCVYSSDTDPKWGVYVCDAQGNCFFNSGGCFDVALGTVAQESKSGGPGSCGDIVNADFGCQEYACGTCTGTDFDTCVASANTNQCATYDSALQSTTGKCAALDDASTTVSSCYGLTDADLTTMTKMMCGPGA